MRTTMFLPALLALPMAFGCGKSDKQRTEVRGTVRVNGALLASGAISFRPTQDGPSSGAEIINGEYRVPRNMGVAVGKNRVSIVGPTLTGRKVEGLKGGSEDEAVQTIPPKYNYATELVCDIQPGSNQRDFDLTIDPKEWPQAAFLKKKR